MYGDTTVFSQEKDQIYGHIQCIYTLFWPSLHMTHHAGAKVGSIHACKGFAETMRTIYGDQRSLPAVFFLSPPLSTIMCMWNAE